ncbi:unnamed protein product [Closterium sp. Yama58-4]|nr:unnamed protein product [Closterium sp. Yama58-4]
MGADHSRPDTLDDDYETAVAPHPAAASPSATVASPSSSKKAPATRLWRSTKGPDGSIRYKLADKSIGWKFTQNPPQKTRDDDDDDEDDDDYKPEGEEEDEDDDEGYWFFVVAGRICVRVDERLNIQFNDQQRRVDFTDFKNVWAIKFATDDEYADFCRQYDACLFENTHGMAYTEANAAKVLGKEFVGWAKGEDAEGAMWEDAAEELPDGEGALSPSSRKESSITESYEETPKGKKPLGFAMGALANSYLIHDGGIDVYKNREDGVHHVDGLSIALEKMSMKDSSTPAPGTKSVLLNRESTMLLMTPTAPTGSPSLAHAAGVRQLDIQAQKVVTEWKFDKDGTEIKMLDITGDSKAAQLQAGVSTFLGLDDNRLCRWDMRDKAGRVQTLASTLASPATLTWSDGHQFSRGTNFQCFATTGDGCVAVGSRDGKIRLYSTTSMRQAKTTFQGLGGAITHIDVTYDGRWVIATTDKKLILICTGFRDKEGKERSAFVARAGGNLAAARLLKLTPEHAQIVGNFKFQHARFSWVTESDRQEKHIVATVDKYTVVWPFRRVKQLEHECYTRQVGRLKEHRRVRSDDGYLFDHVMAAQQAADPRAHHGGNPQGGSATGQATSNRYRQHPQYMLSEIPSIEEEDHAAYDDASPTGESAMVQPVSRRSHSYSRAGSMGRDTEGHGERDWERERAYERDRERQRDAPVRDWREGERERGSGRERGGAMEYGKGREREAEAMRSRESERSGSWKESDMHRGERGNFRDSERTSGERSAGSSRERDRADRGTGSSRERGERVVASGSVRERERLEREREREREYERGRENEWGRDDSTRRELSYEEDEGQQGHYDEQQGHYQEHSRYQASQQAHAHQHYQQPPAKARAEGHSSQPSMQQPQQPRQSQQMLPQQHHHHSQDGLSSSPQRQPMPRSSRSASSGFPSPLAPAAKGYAPAPSSSGPAGAQAGEARYGSPAGPVAALKQSARHRRIRSEDASIFHRMLAQDHAGQSPAMSGGGGSPGGPPGGRSPVARPMTSGAAGGAGSSRFQGGPVTGGAGPSGSTVRGSGYGGNANGGGGSMPGGMSGGSGGSGQHVAARSPLEGVGDRFADYSGGGSGKERRAQITHRFPSSRSVSAVPSHAHDHDRSPDSPVRATGGGMRAGAGMVGSQSHKEQLGGMGMAQRDAQAQGMGRGAGEKVLMRPRSMKALSPWPDDDSPMRSPPDVARLSFDSADHQPPRAARVGSPAAGGRPAPSGSGAPRAAMGAGSGRGSGKGDGAWGGAAEAVAGRVREGADIRPQALPRPNSSGGVRRAAGLAGGGVDRSRSTDGSPDPGDMGSGARGGKEDGGVWGRKAKGKAGQPITEEALEQQLKLSAHRLSAVSPSYSSSPPHSPPRASSTRQHPASSTSSTAQGSSGAASASPAQTSPAASRPAGRNPPMRMTARSASGTYFSSAAAAVAAVGGGQGIGGEGDMRGGRKYGGNGDSAVGGAQGGAPMRGGGGSYGGGAGSANAGGSAAAAVAAAAGSGGTNRLRPFEEPTPADARPKPRHRRSESAGPGYFVGGGGIWGAVAGASMAPNLGANGPQALALNFLAGAQQSDAVVSSGGSAHARAQGAQGKAGAGASKAAGGGGTAGRVGSSGGGRDGESGGAGATGGGVGSAMASSMGVEAVRAGLSAIRTGGHGSAKHIKVGAFANQGPAAAATSAAAATAAAAAAAAAAAVGPDGSIPLSTNLKLKVRGGMSISVPHSNTAVSPRVSSSTATATASASTPTHASPRSGINSPFNMASPREGVSPLASPMVPLDPEKLWALQNFQRSTPVSTPTASPRPGSLSPPPAAPPRTPNVSDYYYSAKSGEAGSPRGAEEEEQVEETPATANVLQKDVVELSELYRLSRKELGRGNFGVIRVCEKRDTGERFACKTIEKKNLECWEDVEDVRREVQVMEMLRDHANVIKLVHTVESQKEVHLIMELCEGGELFDRIQDKGYYSERQAAKVIRTVVDVLQHCHSHGVLHRDLKPENILLTSKRSDTRVKVIDYGMAYIFQPGERCTFRAGTPNYIAPEVINKNYGVEADVWSAGVILYILLCGLPPFWGDTTEEIFKSVLWGHLDFDTEPWPQVSDAAKDLVRRMLCKNYAKRITVEAILRHPWIVAYTTLPPSHSCTTSSSPTQQRAAVPSLTKVVGTVGGTSRSVEALEALLLAGMTVARFDFSHGDAEYHQQTLDNLRIAMRRTKKLCAAVRAGDEIFVGQYLFTGAETTSVWLQVRALAPCAATCLVMPCGASSSHALYVAVRIDIPTLTAADRQHIATWGRRNNVDIISLSFTRHPDDVAQGLKNFESIAEAADGIILSRGNLGIDVPPEKVFGVQKWAVAQCNVRGKPAVITRVLDSMVLSPRPTRAEATDVANAVLDGGGEGRVGVYWADRGGWKVGGTGGHGEW